MDIELKPSPTGQGITPIMPTEPPKEVKDMTFSTDELPSSSENGGTVITTDKGVELKEVKSEEVVAQPKEDTTKTKEVTPTKTVEEVKEKVIQPKKETTTLKVKDTTPPAKEEIKHGPKVFTPVKDKGANEDLTDYTKYSPQEVLNMKNMSRPAREAYARLIEENKQLATLKDASFLQHEDAYTLSPEYKEAVSNDRAARIEAQCWEQSLLAIKAGKPYREIIGWNKDGSPAFSFEKVATDRDEIRINSNLNLCAQAISQSAVKLQSIPTKFKERSLIDLQEINQERTNRFAWVQDPKLLDLPVDVEGQGPTKVLDIKNNFKSLFPSYLRSNPGVEVASDLMVALMIQSAELKEARNGRQIAEIKQDEIARGEPTSEEAEHAESKSKKKGVPSVFTLEGMPER
jgi:hypothetical protein